MRKFLLIKSADAQPSNLVEKLQDIVKRYLPPKGDQARTFQQAYAYETLDDHLSEMMRNAQWALRDSIKSILADPNMPNKEQAINQSLTDFSNVVSGGISQALQAVNNPQAAPMTTTKSKEGDVDMKFEDILKALSEEQQTIIKELPEDQQEKVAKQFYDQNEEVRKAKEQAEQTGTESAQAGKEEFLKQMPEEVRKQFESMQTELEKEKNVRLEKEYKEKAALYKNLPIEVEKFGPVLKNIAESAPEQYEELEKVLKAADAQLEEAAIYKEQGQDGMSPGSAWQEIEKAAEELRKDEPSLTKEQAESEVLKRNPDLYKRYRDESQGK